MKKMTEDMKRFVSLSDEERKAEVLNSLSDAVKEMAERLAAMRRSFVLRFGTEEEFDKAFSRELNRQNRRFNAMSEQEMHIYMTLSIAMNNPQMILDIEEMEEK